MTHIKRLIIDGLNRYSEFKNVNEVQSGRFKGNHVRTVVRMWTVFPKVDGSLYHKVKVDGLFNCLLSVH